MKKLKHLTLLHSNDMHGDFLPHKNNGVYIGGVSMLSGYVNSVRAEEPNTLYVISGDMFRGSLIDSEYKGISTIEILNRLAPDVVTLGNHEVDYGISHMLFLEKCAHFPIINANLYIATNHERLFRSHIIRRIDGMRILFIGVLTDDVLTMTKQDRLIGSFINVGEAAEEIGKICTQYKSVDIDLTVIMTHIGIDEDKTLALNLDPSWGVDCIIGGHSHTIMTQPCVVRGIPIVQAGFGTSHIGRFDITVDTETNSIESYSWNCIQITDCPRNTSIEELIQKYKAETDQKYLRVITTLPCAYTHPLRCGETMLGDLFADILRETLNLDIMLIGSGSIRVPSLGPDVHYQSLIEAFPYDSEIYRVRVNGAQLRTMILHILRDEAFTGHTEFYQFSYGIRIDYSRKEHFLSRFALDGNDIDDSVIYRVGIQKYHMINFDLFFGIQLDEIALNRYPKVVAVSAIDLIDDNLSHTIRSSPPPLDRINFLD